MCALTLMMDQAYDALYQIFFLRYFLVIEPEHRQMIIGILDLLFSECNLLIQMIHACSAFQSDFQFLFNNRSSL